MKIPRYHQSPLEPPLLRNSEVKYTPVMGPCLMSMGFIMPDFVAMHRYWEKVGYPIEAPDQEDFKELVPEPWTIEDYFRSLGDRIPM